MMNGSATKRTDFTPLTYDTLMNNTHSLEATYCCPHTYNFLVPKVSFWDYTLQDQFLLFFLKSNVLAIYPTIKNSLKLQLQAA